MKTHQLRQRFLDYFKHHEHRILPGSSLIPDDPSLLFTNAGMNQFKRVFAGEVPPPSKRVATVQRCLRAGGKHNDLENVGLTPRHHTFFEMLGNFSFGDYFKSEAIHLAWHFLTQVLELDEKRLWISVFEEDKEAEDIWLNTIGIDPQRFSRCGEADNFWSMGPTGPCGPCSEIFYDQGSEIPGGPPGSKDQEGNRYLEIWNLVFMQFNREKDGTLNKLPTPCVDTGMGLERIAAVKQGVPSNYQTDVFITLIEAAAELCKTTDTEQVPLRVIADHIRAIGFLIAEGITPDPEGRGYVLRRIIRRAYRYGYLVGQPQPFLHQLIPVLVGNMGSAYPHLKASEEHIITCLKQEENQFARTITQGMSLLEQHLAKLTNPLIPGKLIFELYDSFGLPTDLLIDIAKERHLTVDLEGFEREMQKQRQRSKAHSDFSYHFESMPKLSISTEFTGYHTHTETSKVLAILQNEKQIDLLDNKTSSLIMLDKTPFYAEGGGQQGDRGRFVGKNGTFIVEDTQKLGHLHGHYGHIASGKIQVGETVQAQVDTARLDIQRHHSATHLLHAALRKILGPHVIQQGSLVAAERLRFDFLHSHALSQAVLEQIENLVNEIIRANIPAKTDILPLEEAKKRGAIALFEGQYQEKVRVLSFGDFSTELCGGTHVKRTGDIGLFKITAETKVSSGIRRIHALAGLHAIHWVNHRLQTLTQVSELFQTQPSELPAKLNQQLQHQRTLEKRLAHLTGQLASASQANFETDAKMIAGIKVLSTHLPQLSPNLLRRTIDRLKEEWGKAIILLSTIDQDKPFIVCGVTKNCTQIIAAPKVLQHVTTQLQGKGGGRADMAQGGAPNKQGLEEAMHSVYAWLSKHL